MDSTVTAPRSSASRLLVVADWELDARAVVAAVSEAVRRARVETVALLVPAWLHGLDWAGDPAASVPCAEAKLRVIVESGRREGLSFDRATVGDADPATAISDAAAEWAPDEVRLLIQPRRLPFGHPLDLRHRAMRTTGLPVDSMAVGRRAAPRPRIASGHCHPTPQT